jgi:hypothetical protein
LCKKQQSKYQHWRKLLLITYNSFLYRDQTFFIKARLSDGHYFVGYYDNIILVSKNIKMIFFNEKECEIYKEICNHWYPSRATGLEIYTYHIDHHINQVAPITEIILCDNLPKEDHYMLTKYGGLLLDRVNLYC